MKVGRGESGKVRRGAKGKRGKELARALWWDFMRGASTLRLRRKYSLKQCEVEENIRKQLI